MKEHFKRLKPGVDKRVLIILAGLMWISAGIMLMILAYGWLRNPQIDLPVIFAAAGILAGTIIHRFGFSKIVAKNLNRIIPMEGKKCAFSFIPWKSYLLIALMSFLGILLRNSILPKQYLSVIYISIGLALTLSSTRYFKVFFGLLR